MIGVSGRLNRSPSEGPSSFMLLADPSSFPSTLESPAETPGLDIPETPDTAAQSVSFEGLGLPRKLIRALAAQDITVPFPIQAATLPDALAGRDVLGRGQTGSGKTLAFGLPLL